MHLFVLPCLVTGTAPVLGEVAEWLKAHAWKACILATVVSGVRIPSSPR